MLWSKIRSCQGGKHNQSRKLSYELGGNKPQKMQKHSGGCRLFPTFLSVQKKKKKKISLMIVSRPGICHWGSEVIIWAGRDCVFAHSLARGHVSVMTGTFSCSFLFCLLESWRNSHSNSLCLLSVEELSRSPCYDDFQFCLMWIIWADMIKDSIH